MRADIEKNECERPIKSLTVCQLYKSFLEISNQTEPWSERL